MDPKQFDALTRQWGRSVTRRTALAGTVAALLAGWERTTALAKKKKRKKKPKACKAGAIKCGNVCVDTKTNALHCGGCGRRCGTNVACVDGQCQGGGCPGSQILCGGLCVNPNNDEQHCGDCQTACNGDLTCLDGECGCAGGTKCGNQCVDTQSDGEHCGSCGHACDTDETCVSGQCNPSGCGPNQIDCGGGLCIPDVEGACCNQDDCGGYSTTYTDLVCDSGLRRCVCNPNGKNGWGICQRFPNGAGICGPCCPGATVNPPCPGELVCRNGHCDCPAEKPEICTYPYGSNKCSMDLDTDPRRCGPNCADCTQYDPQMRCCQGYCIRGCSPDSGGSCMWEPCGPGCTPCPSGQMCCNLGPNTPGTCVPAATFCPQPG